MHGCYNVKRFYTYHTKYYSIHENWERKSSHLFVKMFLTEFFRFVQNLLTISSVMKRFQNRIIKIIQQSEPNKFLYDLLSLAWQVWLKGDNLLFELDILNLSQWEGDWIKILGHNDDLKLWIPKVVEKMVYQCFNVP